MILKKDSVIELFGGEFIIGRDVDTNNPNEYITIEFDSGNKQQVQLKAVASEIVVREKGDK